MRKVLVFLAFIISLIVACVAMYNGYHNVAGVATVILIISFILLVIVTGGNVRVVPIVLFALTFIPSAAHAQLASGGPANPLHDRLTVKGEVGLDHAQYQLTCDSEKGGCGDLVNRTAWLKGFGVEYAATDRITITGRFLTGAMDHQTRNVSYDKYTGQDQDFGARVEFKVAPQAWLHAGISRLSTMNNGIGTQPVYGPPPVPSIPNGRPTPPPTIIGIASNEYKETESYTSFEAGFEGRGSYKRLFYQAGAEIYPYSFWQDNVETSYDDHINKPFTGGGTRGGNAFGWRISGSLGVTLYKAIGLEGNFWAPQYYGPYEQGASEFTSRTHAGVAVVVKF